MKTLRDNDFLRQCDARIAELVESGAKVDLAEVAEYVIINGEARYYVEMDQALRVCRFIRNGNAPAHPLTLRQLMWSEIYRKVKRILDRNSRIDLPQAITRVLTSEKASRFFISTRTGIDIMRRHFRNRK